MITHADHLFSEPGMPRRSGLEHGSCDYCGAHALVDAAWRGDIACSACLRRKYDVPAIGWAHGAIGPVVRVAPPGPARVIVKEVYNLPAPTVRVLVPTPADLAAGRRVIPAEPAQMPARARALVKAAREGGHRVLTSYALAEDTARGALLHSVAVRVQGFGYALYVNGYFERAGVWRPHLRVVPTVGEFEALVAGRPWSPPPPATVGPCPRCGRLVCWTQAMIPFKHNRVDSKESCVAP